MTPLGVSGGSQDTGNTIVENCTICRLNTAEGTMWIKNAVSQSSVFGIAYIRFSISTYMYSVYTDVDSMWHHVCMHNEMYLPTECT